MLPDDVIINAQLVIDRFGRWPTFHDAEVLSVCLFRCEGGRPACEMVIHAWLMTSVVDARNYYVTEKHSLVALRFEGLIESEFKDFNHQNCLFSLDLEPAEFEAKPAIRAEWSSSFGLEGFVLCERLAVMSVTPCDETGRPAVADPDRTSAGKRT